MPQEALPLVTVITPSFNQGNFIRETIESVRNQDYPNIEHIVIDGGSTDDTLDILQEFSLLDERFRFVSETDRGQSHAVNKGLAMAKGDIIGWLNSDDTYQPSAVAKGIRLLQQHPEWAMVYGKAFTMDEFSQIQHVYEHVEPANYHKLFYGCYICQPASFIRKHILQEIGGVDETLTFCMDYDLWIRIAKHYTIGYTDDFLANARLHKNCKTETIWETVGIMEIVKTCCKHYGAVSDPWRTVFLRKYPAEELAQLLHENLPGTKDDSSRFPQVTGMNRYEDKWVPPQFRITMESNPKYPIRKLLVNGKIPWTSLRFSSQTGKYRCTVLVNGQIVGDYAISAPSFTLEIPINANIKLNEVEILSSWFMYSQQDHTKLLSFIAEEVIPLSS